GYLAGLFLAQGDKSDTMVRFHLNANKHASIEKLIRIGESLSGKAHLWTSGNKAIISIYGPAVRGVIEQFIRGDDCYTKHLSAWVWAQSFEFLESCLRGYLDGDGSWTVREGRQPLWRIGFTGKNMELARDLKTACAALDWRISLKPSTATCQTGTFAT